MSTDQDGTKLCEDIARLLGATLEPHGENGAYRDGGARCTDAAGRRFVVSYIAGRTKQPARISVWGLWPPYEAPDGGIRYRAACDWGIKDVPEASCAADRGAEKIAADIERRFMPEFRVAFDQCTAAAETLKIRDETAANIAHNLASGEKPVQHNGPGNYKFWSPKAGSVQVYVTSEGTTVHFERGFNVTPDQAGRILAIMREPQP